MSTTVIPTMLQAMENKDQVTLQHSSRVQQLINLVIPNLIKNNVISHEEVADLWTSAILHDVGKLFVEDKILDSNEKLNKEDYQYMKTHPQRGYNFIRQFNIPAKILLAIKHHHERWDGNNTGKYPGYPDGLKGKKIPIYARIIKIADTYDAITSYRHYKEAKPLKDALNIIKKGAGTQFDPELSEMFVKSLSNSY
ncbi:MAG: HD domain-containing protein [Spirochaetes bacterium]|nr:HD domain-containing protein [Spirochaetota bacterium]